MVLEGQTSSPLDVLSGVPQGTVLGPLLFLVYINDLPKCKNSDARLFADDCLIYRQIWNQRDAANIQDDLTALEEWEWRWQMSFHPKNCTVIQINLQQMTASANNIHLAWTSAGVVESGKYLGVTISQDLQWINHIYTKIGKATRT